MNIVVLLRDWTECNKYVQKCTARWWQKRMNNKNINFGRQCFARISHIHYYYTQVMIENKQVESKVNPILTLPKLFNLCKKNETTNILARWKQQDLNYNMSHHVLQFNTVVCHTGILLTSCQLLQHTNVVALLVQINVYNCKRKYVVQYVSRCMCCGIISYTAYSNSTSSILYSEVL